MRGIRFLKLILFYSQIRLYNRGMTRKGWLTGWVLAILLLGACTAGDGQIGRAVFGLEAALPPIPTVATLRAVEPSATPVPPMPTLAATWTPRPGPTLDGPRGGEVEAPMVTGTPAPFFQLTAQAYMDGPIVIGTSVSGRAIEAYRFGTGPVKRMIVAGIHGGYEWNTVALADRLIEWFTSDPNVIPHTVTLYIVRNLNPDGYARAFGEIEGRTNANGVDLNRNFPVHWQEEWNLKGCWTYLPVTGGDSPGSEPETQALMQFIEEVEPTALISYHSAALGIFPAASLEGLEEMHEASVSLAEALAAGTTYPYPPVDTGCEYTGTLADWAASVGAAAVDFELHTHVLTDWSEQQKVVLKFLAWRRK